MQHERPLGIGIVGFGGFGRFLRESWSTLSEVEVRAAADARSDLDPGDLPFYGTWEELLADPAIDIISIATPPYAHADMACLAMEAGKHVLIEKPLAISRAEAEAVVRVQQETGCVAAVDYMLRFNPIVEVLQDWARRKPFGPLRRVVVENYAQDETLPRDHWFWDVRKSGGILVEHAVHFIDIVHGCTDAEAVSIDGYAIERTGGQTDRVGLTAIYKDGLVMQQYHAFSRPNFFEETSLRFVFDLAQVDVKGWIPLEGTATAIVTTGAHSELEGLPGWEMDELAGIEAGEIRSGEIRSGVIRSGGVRYEAGAHQGGRFALSGSKSEAYADALRALMADVAKAVRDPSHRLRAGLPEGIRSLDVALAGTRAAEMKQLSGK